VAGGAIVALIVVLLLPTLRPAPPVVGPRGSDAPFAGGAIPPGAAGGMQAAPLTGSLREQADRLFNRIMEARSAGDDQQAEFFLPMALMAYRDVPDLDDDGLYHLALLEATGGEPAAGRATAERILAHSPDHLLALAVAAEAAESLGDGAAAAAYSRRFLDAWERERGRDLQEYLDHSRILPTYREAAERRAGR
jgi:hypothetical protein